MPRPSRIRRTPFAQLLLGAASALLLAAALPAEARNVSGAYRACMASVSPRRVARTLARCGEVIDSQNATRAQYLNASLRRGRLRANAHDLSGALSDFQRAVDLNRSDPRALLALGDVQARLNNPDAALLNLAAASDNASFGDSAIRSDAQARIGDIHLQRQHWRRAEGAYDEAFVSAANTAQQVRAALGQGHARFGAGQIGAAIAAYAAAEPYSIEAALALANAHRHIASLPAAPASDFDTAQANYSRVLSRLPARDDEQTRRLRAAAHAGRGQLFLDRYRRTHANSDLRNATADFEAAVENDSQSVDALVGRAAVYALTPENRRRALADLDSALRISPNDPELHSRRGALFADMGDAEAAMRDYDDALRHGGEQSYQAYFRRGVIYLDSGDFRRADQSFEHAVLLAEGGYLPPGTDPSRALAEALMMRSRATLSLLDAPGDRAESVAQRALGYADRAASLQPGQSRYAANRCLTRASAGGDWITAQAACQDAIASARGPGELRDAHGAMGLLLLRWALARAPSSAEERSGLDAAVRSFHRAIGDAGAANQEGAGHVALYRYARGVALQCSSRLGEAARDMREALEADRSVANRLQNYRIRPCNV
jgi:Tfp pilus assembly protein PilF